MSKGKKETELTADELAALAVAEEKAAATRIAAARSAADAAAEEEYKAAAAEAVEAQAVESFSHKRGTEQIFRREMGEPEFYLLKEQRVPARPVLTEDQELEISRRVEIPIDQTPQYNPQYILSPEYAGTSNYEIALGSIREETEEKLAKLENDSDASPQQLKQAEEDLKKLDYLYENFNQGMNVFRTAKDGRAKIQK